QIAEVMQEPRARAVATTALATARTATMSEVLAAWNNPRLGQILGACDPLGGVRQVLPGTGHGKTLLGQVSLAGNLQGLLDCVTVVRLSLLGRRLGDGQLDHAHRGAVRPQPAEQG